MKYILCALVLNYSVNSFAKDITLKEATDFIKKAKCEFSAVLTTHYNSVSTIAVCFDSMKEGGAKGHVYCALRPIDLVEGVYTDDPSRGDFKRSEGSLCNKKAITKILSTNYVKGQLKTKYSFARAGKDKGGWVIVDDKHSVEKEFLNIFKKEVPKKGPYAKYRWEFYPANNSCHERIGGADSENDSITQTTIASSRIKIESQDRLILGTMSNSVKSHYYTTKEYCMNDKERKE